MLAEYLSKVNFLIEEMGRVVSEILIRIKMDLKENTEKKSSSLSVDKRSQ